MKSYGHHICCVTVTVIAVENELGEPSSSYGLGSLLLICANILEKNNNLSSFLQL